MSKYRNNETSKRNNTMKTQLNYNEHLAEHFTLREMTQSGTALRENIANIPTEETVENLRQLCQHVLEPLRRRFGVLRITSGYRSPELNKAVGGVANSQHMRGEAADIHCSSLQSARRMYDYARTHLDFDQLILERRLGNGCCWLHISYVAQPGHRENRHQAFWLKV